jgi:hypothetical protein
MNLEAKQQRSVAVIDVPFAAERAPDGLQAVNTVSKSADPLTRDRGFESGSIQRRVSNEPSRLQVSGRLPRLCGHRG